MCSHSFHTIGWKRKIRLFNSVLGAFTQEILARKKTSVSVNFKYSMGLPYIFKKANIFYSFEYMYKNIRTYEFISGDYINDDFVFLLC